MALQKRTWPTAVGKITQSTIKGKRAIHPEIFYEYEVNDRIYKGKSDNDVPGFCSKNYRRKTENIVKQDNPAGSEILVYYNPQQPHISVLHTGPFWFNFMQIGLGAILFAAGLFGVLKSIIGKFFVSFLQLLFISKFLL